MRARDLTPVTVPRWTLEQFMPTCLGALKIFKAMKVSGRAPEYLTDDELSELEAAIGDVHEILEAVKG